MLVNAIYFLADWQAQFEQRATTEQPFTIAPGKTTPAKLMRRRGSYRLAKVGGVSVRPRAVHGLGRRAEGAVALRRWHSIGVAATN